MDPKVENLIERISNIKLLKEEVNGIINELPSDFEDIIGICFIENYKSRNDEETELLNKLRSLHCHFTWDICTVDEKYGLPIGNRIEKLVGKENYSAGSYNIQHYFNFIQLGYYFAVCKEFEKSLEFLEIAEFVTKTGHLSDIQNGLAHIVCGNRAFVYLLMKNYEECSVILNDVVPHDDLNSVEKAAVLGVYGETLMEVGIDGSEKAVLSFRNALTLDPSSYHWNSYLGVALSRIRHWKFYNIEPSEEECGALRKAVELNPNNEAMPMIYLAQTLREKAANIGYIHGEAAYSTCNEISAEAKRLCDLALESGNNLGGKAFVRLSDVYLKLRGPMKSISKAESCIERALVLEPDDCMVNHKAAMFYEYGKRDYEKALLYMEKAARGRTSVEMFHSHYQLVELKIILDPNFKPGEKLTEILLECKNEDHLLCAVYVFRGFIYYFKQDQHTLAFEDWIIAFQIDSDLFDIEFKRCINSHWIRKTFNSHKKAQILINDLESKISSGLTEKGHRKIYEKIIGKCKIFLHQKYSCRSNSHYNMASGSYESRDKSFAE